MDFAVLKWKRGPDFMFQKSDFEHLKKLESILIFLPFS